MIRLVVLFSIFLVFSLKLFAVEWIFVSPKLRDASLKAARANFLKQEVSGQTVLLFERDQQPGIASIKQIFEKSAMIQFVSSLRVQARISHEREYGSLATADSPLTPFLVYWGEAMGKGGPAVASSFRTYVDSQDLRSDSLMVLAPINLRNDLLTIGDFIDQEYFVPVVAHELYHGLMGDIYGDRLVELKVRSTSRVGHQADRVTDEYLAFSEGIAEAMELATLEMFPHEVNHQIKDLPGWSDRKQKFLGDIMRRRLVSARRNHLSLESDGRKKDGELDGAKDLFRTEGVVATLLYRLFFKSRVEDPFTKVTATLIKHKPLTFLSFLKSFCDDHSEDRALVLRQFLESTRYITVSSKAADLYKDYYLAKKAYKQKEIGQINYDEVVQNWSDFRSRLYSGVLDGSLQIDEAICPEYGVADESFFYELDLNTANEYELVDFFNDILEDLLGEEEIHIHIGKILRLRESEQWILSMDSLPFTAKVEDRLATAHQRYTDEKERQVQIRLNTFKDNLNKLVNEGDPLSGLSAYLSHSYLDGPNE